MAKKLTKGKRKYLRERVSLLCDWHASFWLLGNGWCSIQEAKRDSARREAFMLRQNRAYMSIYC